MFPCNQSEYQRKAVVLAIYATITAFSVAHTQPHSFTFEVDHSAKLGKEKRLLADTHQCQAPYGCIVYSVL